MTDPHGHRRDHTRYETENGRVILQADPIKNGGITHELQDGFQAKRIIDNWMGFYNAERPHTALDKQTPDAAYFDSRTMKKAA
jgi:hypothetical protein